MDMRPDRVLISCAAPGLRRVQATQSSSSHIVIDLAAILRVPSRTLSNSENDFPCLFAGDSEMALGTCVSKSMLTPNIQLVSAGRCT